MKWLDLAFAVAMVFGFCFFAGCKKTEHHHTAAAPCPCACHDEKGRPFERGWPKTPCEECRDRH